MSQPSKSCGDCSLCCKLLGIEELKKRPNTWCEHARPGCKIYHDRPHSCKAFECVWLQSPGAPLEHRPDKIHAFFATMEHTSVPTTARGGLVTVYVDPGYPLAHMEGPILEIAKKMQKRGFRVLAVCGNKGWARLGNGWQQVKMIPKGNEYSGYYDAVIE